MFRASFAVSICLATAAPAAAQVTRVSVSTAGVEANQWSGVPAISADGRFVVFTSFASNLVDGDTNGRPDVFLRDRDTDADGVFDEVGAVATTRLNLGPGGVQSSTSTSIGARPAITPDGRYVMFGSDAQDLLPGGEPLRNDLYRLDRQTNTLIRVAAGAGDYADQRRRRRRCPLRRAEPRRHRDCGRSAHDTDPARGARSEPPAAGPVRPAGHIG